MLVSNRYLPICPPIAKLVYFPCADDMFDMFDPVHALLGSFPFLSAPDKDGTTKLNPCQSQRLHGSFVSQPTTDVLFLQLQPLSGHPVCGVTRNDEAICITPAPPDPLIPPIPALQNFDGSTLQWKIFHSQTCSILREKSLPPEPICDTLSSGRSHVGCLDDVLGDRWIQGVRRLDKTSSNTYHLKRCKR